MQRREFLSSALGAVTCGVPLAAAADTPKRTHGAREPNEQLAPVAARQVEELLWEVQVLNRELAAADAFRSQMLGLIHAMRSPLACIHIVTDIMRDNARDDVSDEIRHYLQLSGRNCERLADLINDVFALERSQRLAQT